MKRKRVLKFIRKAVESLEPQTYLAYHKYHTPQKEENEEGKEVWRMGYLGTHDCNHYRRCKKAYDQFGLPGIQGYLNAYGFELKEKVAA